MSVPAIIAVVFAAIAIVFLALSALYVLVFPKIIVRSLRSGGEHLTFPERYADAEAAVAVEKDCVYPSRFPSATFDLYRPANVEKPPLLVWIHGGFFLAGDKSGVRNVATCLASRGIAVAAINYAVAPEHRYPAAIEQINEFFANLLSTHRSLDLDRIAIAGDSAGGQLASQYAALLTCPALQTAMKIAPSLAKDALKCAVLVCAPIEVAALRGVNKKLDRLLPLFGRAYFGKGKWYKSDRFADTRTPRFVTADYPPTFLTDGNHVSFESQNRAFGNTLRENGVLTEELYFDPNDGTVEHEYLFDLATERAAGALDQIEAFLKQNLTKAES